MPTVPPYMFELAARIPPRYGVEQVYAVPCTGVLLALTGSGPRREHDLQAWANAACPQQEPIILAHPAERALQLAGAGHPFFTRALQNGVLLHGKALPAFGLQPSALPLPRFDRAKGFLDLARACRPEDTALCLFLLHQCLEQAAMQFILSRTGYRMDSHNLTRLLRFCSAINNHTPFTLNRRPFTLSLIPLLNRAYLAGRYDADFHPTCDDTRHLITAVSTLLHRLTQIAHPLTPLPDEEDLRPPIAARV